MPSPRDFLLFRLWGPMSSWGSIAVGEQRDTWQRPSRSAVLGIVAAALGIERANASAHLPLERALGFAVRVDDGGWAMRDYHTAQSPSSEAGRRWRSRYDEIHGAKKLNTILSERSYHAGMNAVVALWRRAGDTNGLPPMTHIADKLCHPTFVLYLGRKASPIGLPLAPFLTTSETVAAAFAAFDTHDAARVADAKTNKQHRLGWLLEEARRDMSGKATYWLDPDDLDVFGPHNRGRETQRRDGIRDRRTWTFNDRHEVEVTLQETP